MYINILKYIWQSTGLFDTNPRALTSTVAIIALRENRNREEYSAHKKYVQLHILEQNI